jgi:NAD(P)-dependent dehydrogenase (short-subunit alcohol dehydrogenase family)
MTAPDPQRDRTSSQTLAEKVVVVTGGARGIGAATAELVARRGASVVIGDLLAEAGRATAERIEAFGGEADFVSTDVTDPQATQALMDHAGKRFGRLDVLICCAGILRGAFEPVDILSQATFGQVMDVNVRGTFLCAKAAVPHMRRAGRGVILLLASGAGVKGPSSSLAYGASKGGVNGFGMTLEAKLVPEHIRVNVICPGSIATTMKLDNIADAARAQGEDPDRAVAIARETGMVGDPVGIARILAFLASDDADYMRGTIFTR